MLAAKYRLLARHALCRALLCAALCHAAAAGATDASTERPQGLLWNRTGLPATLPLTVKTPAGDDYVLRLRDARTGEVALAAYIRGGEAFRLLVPPGLYDVLFDAGQGWQGEPALFGPETRRRTLEAPLSFGAGVARRTGHVIDLSDPSSVKVTRAAECQRFVSGPHGDETALRLDAPPGPPPEARLVRPYGTFATRPLGAGLDWPQDPFPHRAWQARPQPHWVPAAPDIQDRAFQSMAPRKTLRIRRCG